MKPKDGKTLTLKASTGVYPNVVGNIDMSADVTVNDDSFVILQYFADVNNTTNDVTGRYLLLSGGGSSTGMNNPATAQLDMAAFSIKGAWGGTADTLGIQSDLDMTTYDIIDLDRLKFSTIAGSGTALTSSNTGIEALYNAGNPFGMLIQFPSTNSAVMQIKRGTVDMINISSLGVLLGDELLMGGHKITNLGTPTVNTDAATKAYVDASGGSTSFIGFTADANLAMGTYNIEGLDQLIFSTATSSDLPAWNNANYGIEVEGGTTPTALDIRVPSGKFVNVKVASTIEFTFKGNELDCINNDICNVGTIFTDYIATSSGNTNVRVWGHLDPISDGDYDLGSTSLYWRTLRLDGPLYTRGSIYLLGTSKFIDMNANNLVFSTGGRVDFAADTGTPSGAGGYVRVKIGGVDKWMPYYS